MEDIREGHRARGWPWKSTEVAGKDSHVKRLGFLEVSTVEGGVFVPVPTATPPLEKPEKGARMAVAGRVEEEDAKAPPN